MDNDNDNAAPAACRDCQEVGFCLSSAMLCCSRAQAELCLFLLRPPTALQANPEMSSGWMRKKRDPESSSPMRRQAKRQRHGGDDGAGSLGEPRAAGRAWGERGCRCRVPRQRVRAPLRTPVGAARTRHRSRPGHVGGTTPDSRTLPWGCGGYSPAEHFAKQSIVSYTSTRGMTVLSSGRCAP